MGRMKAMAAEAAAGVAAVLLALFAIDAAAQNSRPFPQAVSHPGLIKPSSVSQADMNKAISDFWTYYKAKYIKPSNGGTPGGGYYVEMKGTGGSGSEKTTSEAHGYGMIFCALMAGADPEAKKYYDGFYNMYDKHRSSGDRDLMAWVINQSETGSAGSATDGDMDIAYSLLLAHYQWGSSGAVNYLAESKRMATDGIKVAEMGSTSFRTLLGDFDKGGQWETRPSDWMAGHFEAWHKHTKDEFWAKAKQNVYTLTKLIQTNYSQTTGLVPDFVVGNPAKPAPANFLEFEWDGHFYYNACRFPMRIAVDLAHNQTPDAKAALNKILGWLKTKTGGDPAKITAGYKLDGGAIDASYSESAFTGPLVAAAIADATHQDFLNKGWPLLLERNDYYSDSIALLSMLIISGNWWKPDEAAVTAILSLPGSRQGARGWLAGRAGSPAFLRLEAAYGLDGRRVEAAAAPLLGHSSP